MESTGKRYKPNMNYWTRIIIVVPIVLPLAFVEFGVLWALCLALLLLLNHIFLVWFVNTSKGGGYYRRRFFKLDEDI